MLLVENQVSDGIFVCYYDSSNILASKYIYAEKKLAVIFSKGQQYVYLDVLPYHYQRFKVSKSQGVGLKEFIIKNYKSEKVSLNLDKDALLQISEEISNLKNNYEKSF